MVYCKCESGKNCHNPHKVEEEEEDNVVDKNYENDDNDEDTQSVDLGEEWE